jgi:hypothetical protein
VCHGGFFGRGERSLFFSLISLLGLPVTHPILPISIYYQRYFRLFI